ncbi:hypothetical protein FA10DRAFT_114838 [Acaromyces ingoldii]|uniref:60S ribosomal protein L41 n=1 Tax=Acaromyces ingoldii TaxID=215250 RepID=A0A316YR41_9BASI|nr:hypothetical protein FA10DRAFT_114838 [Acaromyces ingoldii]PWN90503.1 hypothetical protein FA10DRAFT_114838 [Acaromyces ingoldii]
MAHACPLRREGAPSVNELAVWPSRLLLLHSHRSHFPALFERAKMRLKWKKKRMRRLRRKRRKMRQRLGSRASIITSSSGRSSMNSRKSILCVINSNKPINVEPEVNVGSSI